MKSTAEIADKQTRRSIDRKYCEFRYSINMYITLVPAVHPPFSLGNLPCTAPDLHPTYFLGILVN